MQQQLLQQWPMLLLLLLLLCPLSQLLHLSQVELAVGRYHYSSRLARMHRRVLLLLLWVFQQQPQQQQVQVQVLQCL
jgi:hypothetical protein